MVPSSPLPGVQWIQKEGIPISFPLDTRSQEITQSTGMFPNGLWPNVDLKVPVSLESPKLSQITAAAALLYK